eukprot:NODE_1935_length_1331_cov_28.710133_g1839_i0.p1 GENE.NODE_1935_length_1331_cov_28.710133_g1839_i0~~NODE_1935_length_1331_cov_28.710133_g1839_i0.p1  ORF type:complete len:407 (-),score=53.90 NODE_1935_length_1331_cov_28.710133_g1839_i0:111-1331(-)
MNSSSENGNLDQPQLQPETAHPQAQGRSIRVDKGPRSLTLTFLQPVHWLEWIGSNSLAIGGGASSEIPTQLVVARIDPLKSPHPYNPLFEFASQDTIWTISKPQPKTNLVVGCRLATIALLEVDIGSKRVQVHNTLDMAPDSGWAPAPTSKKRVAMAPCGTLAIVSQGGNTPVSVCIDPSLKRLALRGDMLRGHTGCITDIAMSMFPVSSLEPQYLVATVSEDKTLKLWQVGVLKANCEVLATVSITQLRKDLSDFKACRLRADGSQLFAVTSGMANPSYITSFAVEHGGGGGSSLRVVKHKKITDDEVTAFSGNEGFLCCGDKAGAICVVDSVTLSVVKHQKALHSCPITAIDINSTNTLIASADTEFHVRLTCALPAVGGYKWVALGFLLLALLVAYAESLGYF